MTARLRSVPSPTDEPVDIVALNRADIEARDWAACHINGDRNPPLLSWERVRRTWRK
jgi:hypothetical protein